jgi:hypothetical protein
MIAILHSLGILLADMFKSRWRLEAENLFLRQQLNIALRRAPPRLRLCSGDRALLVWMTRIWPGLLGMAQVADASPVIAIRASMAVVQGRLQVMSRSPRLV